MGLESLATQFNLAREIESYKLKSSLSEVGGSTEVASTSNSDAVISHVEDSAFSQKLYKHINDHYKGEGQISRDVNRQLAQKDSDISNALNSQDPKASLQYSAYSTAGFSYSSRARFISGIDSTVKLSSGLRKIYAKA